MSETPSQTAVLKQKDLAAGAKWNATAVGDFKTEGCGTNDIEATVEASGIATEKVCSKTRDTRKQGRKIQTQCCGASLTYHQIIVKVL